MKFGGDPQRRLPLNQANPDFVRKPVIEVLNIFGPIGERKDLERLGIGSDHAHSGVHHNQPGACCGNLH
jgi:hypothetical protein